MSDVNNWKNEKLDLIRKNYDDTNVFNLDATGLFWKMLPEKTLHFKGERCAGGSKSKERITVLVGGSMNGEKLPLLVIGKYKNPRCFKNRALPDLSYKWNKKAWMTSEIYDEWLRKFDRTNKAQNRKVALIVDNCPAHPIVENLTNTTVYFLPPNTTSVTQPMDAGIIKNLKVHYRNMLIRKRLFAIQNSVEIEINLLDSLKMLFSSWAQVSRATIHNCFRHAGFSTELDVQEIDTSEDNQEIQLSFTSYQTRENLDEGITMEAFLGVDDDVFTVEEPTVVNDNSDAQIPNNSDEEDDSVVVHPPKLSEVLQAISILERHNEHNLNNDPTIRKMLSEIEEKVVFAGLSSQRQTLIQDYFH